MRRIFIMRHAEPDNPDKIVYGNHPVGYALNDLGKLQAHQAGEFLADIPLGIIISSPRERTRQTANIVAELNIGHPQVVIDERIHDSEMGKHQGILKSVDYQADAVNYWRAQLAGEDGMEMPTTIAERMLTAFKESLSKYPDGNILFVSHADPTSYLFQKLSGESNLVKHNVYGFVPKAGIFEIMLEPFSHKLLFKPND